MSMLRVTVAHRHPIVAAGVAAALMREPDIVVSVESIDAMLASVQPAPGAGVAVVDYHDGGRLASRPLGPAGLRVVVVTSLSRSWEVRAALQAGVLGYALVSGPLSEMVHAVRSASRGVRFVPPALAQQVATMMGQEDLTEREIEVLARLMRGCSNKEISVNLGIALGTVKCHVRAILGKLDASSRTEAVVMAYERGILERDAVIREALRASGAAFRPETAR